MSGVTTDNRLNAHTTRRLTPEDYYKFQTFMDLQVSQDGRYAATVVSSANKDADKFTDDLVVFRLTESTSVRVKLAGSGARALAFSPDGNRLAWVDNVDGTSQVHISALTDLFEAKPAEPAHQAKPGEQSQDSTDSAEVNSATGASVASVNPSAPNTPSTVQLPTDKVENAFEFKSIGATLVWSQDGSSIYLATSDKDKPKNGIRVYTAPRYKADGLGLLDKVTTTLWRVAADGRRQEKLCTWAGPILSFDVSPDGGQLVFAADHDIHLQPFLTDLYSLDTSTGEVTRLFESKGMAMYPVFATSGLEVVCVSSRDTLTVDGTATLFSVDATTGQAHELAPGFDRPTSAMGTEDLRQGASGPAFTSDGKAVRFLAADKGQSRIYEVKLPSGAPEVVSPEGFVSINQFALASDGTMVFVASDSTHPPEVFVARPGASEAEQLTALNAGIVEGLNLREVIPFSATSFDGQTVEGFLQLPPAGSESRGAAQASSATPGQSQGSTQDGPYPLVLYIHGGPRGAWGSGFSFDSQALASSGKAVLYMNPRGSDGYGKQFANAVLNDWGGGDYQDLMAAVDAAIDQGYADGDRLGVTGYSYGGFMTSWVIGHTQRFKAAAPGGAVTNLVSFHGTSDIGWFWGPMQHSGNVWEDMKHLWAMSPMAYVQNVTTPTLIYHSAGDDRCPIGQSEELYSALKARGVDATFVRYSEASHTQVGRGPKPSLRVDRTTRVIDWFTERL